jgi:hypothetical protein
MKHISVVGTVHEECGPANASALLDLLESIKPEVIFLEMPPDALHDYFGGARQNLESTAVNRYRAGHEVEFVAVDLPTPDESFFRKSFELNRTLKKRSYEYFRLVQSDTQYIHAHGFAYLNSEHYDRLWSEVHEVTLIALKKLADKELEEFYQLFGASPGAERSARRL